jgi:hypothetical protein
VPEADIETEQQWLSDYIYKGKTAQFIVKEITAADRYSVREFTAP